MVSHWPDFVLVNVLQHVQAWDDLARIAAVNKQACAISRQLQAARFTRNWGLADLVGWPRRPLPVRHTTATTPCLHFAYTQSFELSHFMLRHTVHKVQPAPVSTVITVAPQSDNFARLSITYGCEPATIRATNNVISDSSLQSRLHVYVPVHAREQLAGRVACVVFDRNSSREHVVVLSPDEAAQKCSEAPSPRGMHALRRLSSCLSKGLKVDDDTAAFYLMEAGGDVRTALQLYSACRMVV